MIDEKKYVKVISKQPASGVKTAVAANILNQDITITTNGVYRAEAGYTGFGTVTVNVPTEASGSVTFTENGTYDITQYASVTVAVPMNTVSLSVTENGTYTPGGSNIGFSSVSVAVPNQTTSTTINYNGTYYPESPYIGFDSVTVSMHVESLTIAPTTSTQTYYGTDEVAGYSPVIVEAVTPAIDSNIQAANIKSGVSILGVAGTVTELKPTALNVTPKTFGLYFEPSGNYNGYDRVYVSGVTSSIDSNIQAGNIKSGVTILGVTGTLTPAPARYIERNFTSGTLKLSPVNSVIDFTGVTAIGDYALMGACAQEKLSPSSAKPIPDLSNITSVGSEGFSRCFQYYVTNNGTVNLGSLASVGSRACNSMFLMADGVTSAIIGRSDISLDIGLYGQYTFDSMFNGCTSLTTAEIRYKELKGTGTCYMMFNGCTGLTTLKFDYLQKVSSSYMFVYMCDRCTSLQSLSFPSLLSNFTPYTGIFDNMLYGVTGCTVHFPSNLQSVIGSWTSVTNGFGGTNTTVLFDLPATA